MTTTASCPVPVTTAGVTTASVHAPKAKFISVTPTAPKRNALRPPIRSASGPLKTTDRP